MKYELKLHNSDGTEKKTCGTDFISTNTLIKAIKCLEEIEKEKDAEAVISHLAKVVTYLIPDLTIEEVKEGADFGDLMTLIKSVVKKVNDIEPSKN